ncbi:hypothetical protein BSKO_09685 [Bryopsis sp. KO-2023]|nr:hypothetical protein BSKO_09685 [Bryopsis sp. KO-2023]
MLLRCLRPDEAEATSPARRGRKGCPVFANSVQVDDEKATLSAAPPQRKGLPASARDLQSEMLTSLTGSKKDKFFVTDHRTLQANEVQELWMLTMNQCCDATRIAKVLDNSFWKLLLHEILDRKINGSWLDWGGGDFLVSIRPDLAIQIVPPALDAGCGLVAVAQSILAVDYWQWLEVEKLT